MYLFLINCLNIFKCKIYIWIVYYYYYSLTFICFTPFMCCPNGIDDTHLNIKNA